MKTLSLSLKKVFGFVILFVFIFGTGACSKRSDEASEAGEADVSALREMPPPPAEPAPAQAVSKQADGAQSEPQFQQKIIRNAAMRFQVADYKKSISTIQNLLQAYGAYLVSSNEVRVDNSLENNLTIRVPSKNLDALLEKLAGQSIYLDYKNITSEDVTTEFVDISARLKTKKAVEQRYLELLKQAKNVKDIIEVENQLRQIREEIEGTQARINYINQQVSYSTVTVQIYEESARQTGDQNFLVRLLNALRNGWELLLSFVVGMLYIWPFILLTILVILLLRKFIRKHPPVR